MTGLDLATGKPGAISDRYVIPPFSILDSRLDYWQKRRRWWLALGIQSELGRAEDMAFSTRRGFDERYGIKEGDVASGTSVFDPVLCEMAYRWWAPAGGSVLDPFAGGSVRGIVAAMLGHDYTGVDLSAAQVESNRRQAADILTDGQPIPRWIHGDSRVELASLPGSSYDLVLTCPPYYDLEVYSDHPADLSNAPTYGDFLIGYRHVLSEAARALRPGRYAVVVVSEVRDRRGRFHGLVPDTIAALADAGLAYYNEAILVNAIGTLPLRITHQFEAARKLGRMHQNVIVAVKGEPERGWSHERAAPPDPQMSLFGTVQ